MSKRIRKRSSYDLRRKQKTVPITETRCVKDPKGKCEHLLALTTHRPPTVLRCKKHGQDFYIHNEKHNVHPQFGQLCGDYKPPVRSQQ